MIFDQVSLASCMLSRAIRRTEKYTLPDTYSPKFHLVMGYDLHEFHEYLYLLASSFFCMWPCTLVRSSAREESRGVPVQPECSNAKPSDLLLVLPEDG